MFSAAELLEVLRRRRTLKSIRPEEPGRLPPGWERWLEAMPARSGAVKGAPPSDFVDLIVQWPLRPPPPRGAVLTRWQAFGTLWRQQWHPASREERGLRVFAMAASFAVHLCFGVLLAWLMYLHFLMLPVATGEVQVVQVEYIGTGTPEDVGGGQVPPVRETGDEPARPAAAASMESPTELSLAPAETAPAPAVPALPELPVDVAAPALAAAAPPLPQREIPTPALPETAQPLQVTEVAQPDIDFVLPPTTTQVVPVRRPELAVPTRDVPAPEVVEALDAELPSRLPSVAVEVPDATQPVLALPQRDIPVPEAVEVARLPERAVPAPVVVAPSAPSSVPDIEIATIPVPPGNPAAPAGERAAADAGAASTATADAGQATTGEQQAGEQSTGEAVAGAESDTGAADAAAGAQSPATVAGAGRESTAPGGWPSPNRGDDWDDASSNRPGGQAGEGGVFDATGRPVLAGTGDNGPPGGAPPGSQAREAIDLAKGGTWLRRPPYDYEPTRFDRFWIPTGSLLEEWVRRGIKQMSIPIPGTSKEIVCVVSILQLGGGCMLTDPNINDQPSSGRAAPDIPFKPELQEDQDSLARPPGG